MNTAVIHSMIRTRRRSKRLIGGCRPILHIDQILVWADEHFARTGRWPTHESGLIPGTLDEKWGNIDRNLRDGHRGLRPGSSIARLLALYRGHRNRRALPVLTVPDILSWADAFFIRTGAWPLDSAGPIPEAPGETWSGVNSALYAGIRGLPGGSSLARVLEQHRGVRNCQHVRPLTVRQILAWADDHYRRTREWPKSHSGPILTAPGETWHAIDAALWVRGRGLRKKSSLARLLAKHRGVPNIHNLAPLTFEQILQWADAHFERTGVWPKRTSGRVHRAPGERWNSINASLHFGTRSLPAGYSLAKLLERFRNVSNRKSRPSFSLAQIIQWADAHYRRTGRWPTRSSGKIANAPDETWGAVDGALKAGSRGLPGGSSLCKLLQATFPNGSSLLELQNT